MKRALKPAKRSAERFRRYARDPAGEAGELDWLVVLPSIEGRCWGKGPESTSAREVGFEAGIGGKIPPLRL